MVNNIEKRICVTVECRRCNCSDTSFVLYSGASFVFDGYSSINRGYFLCIECGKKLETLFDNIDRQGLSIEKAEMIIKEFIEEYND